MLKQSNFFTHNIGIAWKTFVRESCDVSPIPSEKKEHRLNFQDNQAKEAYEEIIHEKNDVNIKLQHKHCKQKSFVTQNATDMPVSMNGSNEKVKYNSRTDEKVTINAILKAVEQKDFEFLLKHMTHDNVNLMDDFGWTPLMSAAYCGHLDIVEFLLNLGANRKVKEKSGLTAAQLALKKNYLNIVALLKKRTQSITNKTLAETDAYTSEINTDAAADKKSDDNNEIIYHNIDNEKNCPSKSTGFYCDICEVHFYDTTWKKHQTSTLHIFNSKPKLPSTMYGISKQNKGYQMLLNHGWDEECGLGPSGKGIKYPVKTCLKTDRKGIGQPNEKEYRKALKHIQQVEEKAGEILTDRQEIIALDKRRNDDRVGMRALQKAGSNKTWITVGPLLLKMSSKTAEELLVKDQKECEIEINKIRSNLKIKVNELRDLELNPPVPGLMLQPMSHKEMSAIKQVLGS
ncbi:uncharacterized protein LOC117601159 [Osmia lignaria lignaria]|uniref:uncharacterized protein LOC117601159 n=1 Tax=Osmia lignaria lignaria TaxID=1437193 RepID=UPI00402B275F